MITIIEMDWDDIARGEAENCANCPATRAINRKLLPEFVASVGNALQFAIWRRRDGIFWCPEQKDRGPALYVGDLPVIAGEEVEPITFSLNVPQKFRRDEAEDADHGEITF